MSLSCIPCEEQVERQCHCLVFVPRIRGIAGCAAVAVGGQVSLCARGCRQGPGFDLTTLGNAFCIDCDLCMQL